MFYLVKPIQPLDYNFTHYYSFCKINSFKFYCRKLYINALGISLTHLYFAVHHKKFCCFEFSQVSASSAAMSSSWMSLVTLLTDKDNTDRHRQTHYATGLKETGNTTMAAINQTADTRRQMAGWMWECVCVFTAAVADILAGRRPSQVLPPGLNRRSHSGHCSFLCVFVWGQSSASHSGCFISLGFCASVRVMSCLRLQ